MGLVRRVKKRRRLPEGLKKPLDVAKGLNEVWSLDFMSDTLIDGRQLRVLNIIDEYNRESLVNEGGISLPSSRVIRSLNRLIEELGKPKYIRSDNGPEFISREYRDWCEEQGITPLYISPGKPMENGYIERFNRTFREDVLDAYLFTSISQYNLVAEKWREDYNDNHPHQSLQNKSPREYAPRRHHPSGVGGTPNPRGMVG